VGGGVRGAGAIVGYPAKFGTAVDSFTSEYLNQKLNNNEKKYKKSD